MTFNIQVCTNCGEMLTSATGGGYYYLFCLDCMLVKKVSKHELVDQVEQTGKTFPPFVKSHEAIASASYSVEPKLTETVAKQLHDLTQQLLDIAGRLKEFTDHVVANSAPPRITFFLDELKPPQGFKEAETALDTAMHEIMEQVIRAKGTGIHHSPFETNYGSYFGMVDPDFARRFDEQETNGSSVDNE